MLLAVVALGGFAIRVVYVLVSHDPTTYPVDAFYYHHGANLLAHGEGFINPIVHAVSVSTVRVEGASHGPGWIVLLAVPSFLGFEGPLAHQVFTCIVGTATIAVVGLLGRDLAGARVGLLAAVLAAVYPNIWMFDASLNSETLAVFLTAVLLLLAYRYARGPSTGLAVALGAVCAVSALTRAETVMYLPLVLLWVWWAPRAADRPRSVRAVVAGFLAFIALVLPWSAYNTTRFEHPVPLSAGLGFVLRVANCDIPYYGEHVGHWSFECGRADPGTEGDQSSDDLAYRRHALEYIREHWTRVPVVVAARVARTFGLYEPVEQVRIDEFEEHRPFETALAGLAMYYALVVAAAYGFVVLRRRGVTVLPLVAVVGIVVVTVIVTFGQTRYRATAEIPLVVGAAVGIDAFVRRRRDVAPEQPSAR